MKWLPGEFERVVEELAAGRSYAQIARTLNTEFHRRRVVRTDKAVELKCRREQQTATQVRAGGGDTPSPADVVATVEPLGSAVHDLESGSTRALRSQGTSLQSVDALLDARGVSREEWEVKRQRIKTWDVGAMGPDGTIVTEALFGIDVTLHRRAPSAVAPADERAALLEEVRASAPLVLVRDVRVTRSADVALEIGLTDVHFNKLAWAEECGESYDFDEAEAEVDAGIARVLNRSAAEHPGRAVLLLGNDGMHIDTRQYTTTAGTLMDADTRYWRMVRRTRQIYSRVIRTVLQEVGPTDVMIVPGNHDELSTQWTGELLACEFANSPFVNVCTSLYPRKYWRFGTVLLGFTHGNEEKHADLPLLMANEVPQAWADTTHREWHVGHFHKIKETRYTAADSFGGVRVRVLPALSGADMWHVRKGYVGELRSVEGYLWHRTDGYLGHVAYTRRVPKQIAMLTG